MDKAPEKIQTMFSKVAPMYDRANAVLSFGIFSGWYKKVIKAADFQDYMKILDCATGTGNLAFEFYKKLGNDGEITGIDFTESMLEIAKKKLEINNKSNPLSIQENKKDLNNQYITENKLISPQIKFEYGDVLNLKYPNNSFDIVSIAFGIRNVESIDICLKEMARVAKKGGKVIILEFGQPIGILKYMYKVYFKIVMPIISIFLSLDKDSYNYLIESSSKFPCRNNFLILMNNTGSFSLSKYKILTLGIAYIYIGIKN